jgi:ATP-dependent DNA helicase RecG
MAPTEILAKQHLKSFRKFIIDSKINVDLLVSNLNTKEKKNIKEKVASNVTNIIIGTHAILQEDVKFNNVGLIITDEQHRFGVKQRSRLFNKSENPNTIVMSATPIPRTLSLVLYGDLDILYLKDKPSGRKRINTYCLNNNYFYRVADFIEQQVKNGMQGYIVCPYINSEDQFLSVEVVEKELSKKYKNINFGILHGKMNTDEKEIALEKFLENEINVLICTTIIEVGIDVPNSTVMLILGGERFGLSQLHQLRGRVGRGCKESNCFVLYNSTNEKTKKRMDVFKSCNNGFEIAEEDLKLRGSGDYLGLRQHGSNFAKYLDLIKDYNVIIESNDIAKRIFESDTEEDIAYRKQLIRQFENDMKEIVFN